MNRIEQYESNPLLKLAWSKRVCQELRNARFSEAQIVVLGSFYLARYPNPEEIAELQKTLDSQA